MQRYLDKLYLKRHRAIPISNWDKKQRIGYFIAAALVANGLWSIAKPVDVGYKKRFKRISSKAAFPSQRVGKVLAKETKDLLDAFSPSSEVLVGVRPDGERGLFASRDFKRGDVVVSIDEKFIIGESYLRDHPWVKECVGTIELNEWFSEELWDPSEAALALALVYEKRQANNSKWETYFSTLPLHDHRVEALPKYHKMLRRFWFHIPDLQWQEFWPIMFYTQYHKTPAFSYTRQIWENVKQCFPLPIQSAIPVFQFSRFSEAIVPILDMANHSDQPSCSYEPFRFVALRDIMEGDEITWNYDPDLHPDAIREKFNIEKPDASRRKLFAVDLSNNK